MSINVSIIEDQEKTRESLRTLIDGTAGFSCVSTHPAAEHALANLPAKRTHVALVDLVLPKMSGIECVRELRNRHPHLLVLILTVHEDIEMIFDSLMAGAHGYLLKTMPPAQILSSIREVCEGGAPMSPAIARKVIQHFHGAPAVSSDLEKLTRREHDILQEVATGRTFKEIAERKSISYETVKAHMRSVYQKLHVSNRTSAVVKFLAQR